MRKLVFLSWALGMGFACGGPTSLDIEKYDRTCGNLNDCVLVATDACCGCKSSAINVNSLTQYQADLASAKNNCGGVSCPNMTCANLTVGCAAGLCISMAPVADAGTD
jgi:hypothetical protein